MAIPIAKLTVIVGAGLVGSILIKEGRLSDVPNFVSGAFKIFRKHLKEDNSKSSSASKAGSDYLITQVNSLRQQLQHLQSSGPVTIITESRRGSGSFSIMTVVVVGVVGYGYIWWKGWKISDMMFVTRRGFSDACNRVGKQVDLVSSSVSTTKRQLSSKIDDVDSSLKDCLDTTNATKEEVSELHGELSGFHVEVESVHRAVQTLESKLVKIEGRQDIAVLGVDHLVHAVRQLGNGTLEHTRVLRSNSARLAIEDTQDAPIRIASLPPIVSAAEAASPSTPAETPRVLQSSRTATASYLKEVQGLPTVSRSTSLKPSSLTDVAGSEPLNGPPSVADDTSSTKPAPSSSGWFGWRLPNLSILTRTRSTSDAT